MVRWMNWVANMTGASDLRAEALQTKIAELSVTGAAMPGSSK
jgi:hypothetical protein